MINSDNYTLADFLPNKKEASGKLLSTFYEYCEDYIQKGYNCYERPLVSACRNRVRIFDHYQKTEREMIMMGSNNYLGLSSHPNVLAAGFQAAHSYGFGSGGVPLFSGTYDLHKELEQRIAVLKGCEDAIIFSSGYVGNIGCITALFGKNDTIIQDRLNHASLIDGARFCGAKLKVFRHNNKDHLEKVLKELPCEGFKLIVVDGVFSMDGDIADLPAIRNLAKQYDAKVMIDEAHATGVIGPSGKGTPEHYGLSGQIDIVGGTLSKALAGIGGFIASSREVVNYLRFYSRSNMFSTSLPPSTVAALIAAIDVLETEPDHHRMLWDNIEYMIDRLKKMGFNIGQTRSAIIPLIVGNELKLRRFAKDLHEAGIYVNSVPYPAVPKKLSRVRLSLMAQHTLDDLDETLDILEQCGKRHDLLGHQAKEEAVCSG